MPINFEQTEEVFKRILQKRIEHVLAGWGEAQVNLSSEKARQVIAEEIVSTVYGLTGEENA